MKLNHINLVVSDVAAAIHLFETYFNFYCIEIKGGNSIAILEGSDGFILVVMNNKGADHIYPTPFHIGFMHDSTDEVIAVYEQLKNGGIAIGLAPQNIRDSFGFYFNFDNIMIEVGHYYPA
jgi:hypothetical protein